MFVGFFPKMEKEKLWMVLILAIGAIWRGAPKLAKYDAAFLFPPTDAQTKPGQREKEREEKYIKVCPRMTNALSCQIEIFPHFTLRIK
jgi:hypothetical protein